MSRRPTRSQTLLLLPVVMLLAACAAPAATGTPAASRTPAATQTAAASATPGSSGTPEASGTVTGTPTGPASGSPPASGPIRIGISLPLTGDFTEPGEGVRKGYEVWADDVNKAGGLLGRQVELIIVDDASDPNRAVADYERLITVEKVDLVFGPFSSRLVIPTSEVAERNKMLFVEPAGAAPDVFNRGLKYLFYAAPATAPEHGKLFAEWLVALPADQRPKSAFYAKLDDPFGIATADGIKADLEAAGITTAGDVVYPENQLEFGPLAGQIRDSGAELVVGGTQYQDAVELVKALKEREVQPKAVIMTTGPTIPTFPEGVGGGAEEGIMSPVGWSIDSKIPTNQEFVASYKAKFNEDPSEDPANAYTVGQVVAQAVEAVGSLDNTALRDHIAANDFETVVGPLSFNEKGEPQGAHMILQWQGGTTKIVLSPDPAAIQAQPIYPKPAW